MMSSTEIHKETLELIIKEISEFKCIVVFLGRNETEEEKIINSHADGVTQGYNDAVKQIVEFLIDLRSE